MEKIQTLSEEHMGAFVLIASMGKVRNQLLDRIPGWRYQIDRVETLKTQQLYTHLPKIELN